MKETIGFIGLGSLGLPVATNLLNAGYPLVVHNRTVSKAEPLIAQGARLASRPDEAVTPGGIVVTLLWDDASVESIAMSDGFLEKLGKGGIHISMSTVSPDTSRKLAALHAEHGSILVEAPIFGVPEAAAARQLSIPVAGPEKAKERVRPVLEAMGGANIFDFGEEAGAANQVKLVGNFMITSAVYTIREALTMVEKSGGDPKAVMDMLTQTLFNAPIYKRYGQMAADNLDHLFTQSHIPLKDVGIFKQASQRAESPAPLSSLLYDLLRSEQKQG
ncbi:NAD(P)-dependent oxidoreductase [Paenibacillus sp. XY044]|uniref:NAD(P)-dependent oxidoreductase n=1 Tax=Paenibacillus sp. XY044 TaxID=2026089 RepID=UPI000B98C371|nr:NAD(P)-dependent oxidoreductase [Paenibacillus sp. XY044]OZB96633.1 6-phosphogluconate dehydrogenase [Paenibacillus sp. XY044]